MTTSPEAVAMSKDLKRIFDQLEVLQLMMAEELGEVVGPKGKHDQNRNATRPGSEDGSVVIGAARPSVTRPRPLPRWFR